MSFPSSSELSSTLAGAESGDSAPASVDDAPADAPASVDDNAGAYVQELANSMVDSLLYADMPPLVECDDSDDGGDC